MLGLNSHEIPTTHDYRRALIVREIPIYGMCYVNFAALIHNSEILIIALG